MIFFFLLPFLLPLFSISYTPITLNKYNTLRTAKFTRLSSVLKYFDPLENFSLPAQISVHSHPKPDDTVFVTGATGGVGQLVVRKLLDRDYNVIALTRSAAKAEEIFDDLLPSTSLEIFESNVNSEIWAGDQYVKKLGELQEKINTCEEVVICSGTSAFPTTRWRNSNRPYNVDEKGTQNIVSLSETVSTTTIKKIVYLSSIGTRRERVFPFTFLNLFGVLDAKKGGEIAVENSPIPSVIIRPGRLVGGPYTATDLASLMKLGGGEKGCEVKIGDSLTGDCERSAAAESVVQALLDPCCKNLDFSIIDDTRPTKTKAVFGETQWMEAFSQLEGYVCEVDFD